MKTNHKFAHFGSLMAVAACLLSASSIHAQTFMGQEKLATDPTGFEAVVYPVTSRPATIRVNFSNPNVGKIRVVIRDESGHNLYDAFETGTRCIQQFDLSPMPAGKYTVELSKRNEYFIQTFTIEPPTERYISMGTQPVRKAPESPVDRKLIVSQ